MKSSVIFLNAKKKQKEDDFNLTYNKDVKLARSFLFLTILIVTAVAVLYFFAPLGLQGFQDDDKAKVSSLLMDDWDYLGIEVVTYNVFRFKEITFLFAQENTWWIFGLLGISVYLMLPLVGFKSIWPYLFVGFLGIIVALGASFFAGGIMILAAIIGIISYSRWKLKKLKRDDYSYLYREYIT